MKKFKNLSAVVLFMCTLLVLPEPVRAQSSKAAEYIGAGVVVATSLFGLLKGKKSKKSKKASVDDQITTQTGETYNAATSYQSSASLDGAASQQQRNMTIVTNHPDFSVKVKRCAASGKTVIIDLILENIGTNDVVIGMNEFAEAGAYDDQGNFYSLTYKYANDRDYEGRSYDHTLLPGVPAKLSIKIEGVPLDVESIARLKAHVYCDAWGLGDKSVTIRNIPVTRK